MTTGTAARDVDSGAIVRPARWPAGAFVTGAFVAGALVSCLVAGLLAGALVFCLVAGVFVPCAEADAATVRRTMPRRRTLRPAWRKWSAILDSAKLEHVRLNLEAGVELLLSCPRPRHLPSWPQRQVH